MPTSASATYSNTRVEPAFAALSAFEAMIAVQIAASQTLAAGTVVGEVSATPGVYKAYNSANADGTQNPAGILAYAVTTDASGNILNDTEWGTTALTTPMYTKGAFRTSDLTGLDANAMTKLGGHLAEAGVYIF